MANKQSGTSAQHSFANVAKAEIQRSVFNRSSNIKTTFDGGQLIPIFVDEALPGDTMNCRLHTFARLATPLHPILDNLTLDTFFFAVPIRLVWNNWAKMLGEQENPGDSTTYLVPQLNTGVSGITEGQLSDYLGIPLFPQDLDHSSLWHRAYNLIYNEWFRSEDLLSSAVVDKDDGPDDIADYVIRGRCKRPDYFTSCLPWPQKGDAVLLPIGDTAPVVSTGDGRVLWQVTGGTTGPQSLTTEGSSPYNIFEGGGTGFGATSVLEWNDPKLEADLASATAATINEIRQAFQIQRLFERDARGGTRLTEIIRSHFGVVSPDARLQRPEFLGGGSQVISITPVPQTSSTDGTSPQGNLSAYGVSSGSNHSWNKSFTEHCLILGLVNVRAPLSYQQGLPRMFSRRSRWDFYWPALAHLGEQVVKNKEIFALGDMNPTFDEAAFGYQERWAEYRYKPSMITGQFRSDAATPLDTWHLAQDFAVSPLLSTNFILDNPPIDRVIAVPTEPHILFDGFFDLKHARPMPTFSTPGLIDHF